jgi:hypothetical protein
MDVIEDDSMRAAVEQIVTETGRWKHGLPTEARLRYLDRQVGAARTPPPAVPARRGVRGYYGRYPRSSCSCDHGPPQDAENPRRSRRFRHALERT